MVGIGIEVELAFGGGCWSEAGSTTNHGDGFAGTNSDVLSESDGGGVSTTDGEGTTACGIEVCRLEGGGSTGTGDVEGGVLGGSTLVLDIAGTARCSSEVAVTLAVEEGTVDGVRTTADGITRCHGAFGPTW